MKAIHNLRPHRTYDLLDVVMLSKIEKMKAIHNDLGKGKAEQGML